MTKKQAMKDFTKNILPYIIQQYGNDDRVAKRTAWNDYTDMLCKNEVITLKQYEGWDNTW